MLKLLAVIACTASAAATDSADTPWVFVDSAVGQTRLEGRETPLRQNDRFPARESTLSTGPDGFLGLYLANGLVVYMDRQSRMRIEEFDFIEGSAEYGDRNYEPAASTLRLALEHGTFVFKRPVPRPTSELILATPYGVIESQSRSLVVLLTQGKSKAYILSESAFVSGRNTERKDFIRGGQWVNLARVDRGSYTGVVESIHAPEMEELEPLLERADSTLERLWFVPGTTPPQPLRMLSPEQFTQPAYNEYRIH